MAFDMDLGLIGFPTGSLENLIDQVITETNIGHGGEVLRHLLTQDRIHLLPGFSKDPPAAVAAHGLGSEPGRGPGVSPPADRHDVDTASSAMGQGTGTARTFA